MYVARPVVSAILFISFIIFPFFFPFAVVDYNIIGGYATLYENNYLEKLRIILDNYKIEHQDQAGVIEESYESEVYYVNKYPTSKIKFSSKLKKG